MYIKPMTQTYSFGSQNIQYLYFYTTLQNSNVNDRSEYQHLMYAGYRMWIDEQ